MNHRRLWGLRLSSLLSFVKWRVWSHGSDNILLDYPECPLYDNSHNMLVTKEKFQTCLGGLAHNIWQLSLRAKITPQIGSFCFTVYMCVIYDNSVKLYIALQNRQFISNLSESLCVYTRFGKPLGLSCSQLVKQTKNLSSHVFGLHLERSMATTHRYLAI